MIVETRELFFSNSALKKAIAWYQKAPNQTDLPLGVVTAVAPKTDGGLSVQIQQSGASKSREVTFTPSKTLALLLLFCRRQKVPIPRDAAKDLETVDDGLILIVRGETATTAPPH
ncbi:hypothetical protein [Azospirillum sp. TSO35-2]|uniref:hypothetical protein n=1 Tax=Azospirillum sp. TSO35-2 TaxID=716796 RepID=UPI000D61B2A3|nr:hypothetical protein [Azospirillum sp. TSO35-2]PWC33933.1 hypothetical protein TSO352_26655 [Azospirillum sp. TSO35-2]